MQSAFPYLGPDVILGKEVGLVFKSLNVLQLQKWIDLLRDSLAGAQLQQVWSFNEGLVLKIYLRAEYYLVLDLKVSQPAILLLQQEPPFKKEAKPVALFLNSHAKNLRLTQIELQQEYGRVVKLQWSGGPKTVSMQAVLIPRQANLHVEAEGKKISFYKPQVLSPTTGKLEGLSEEFTPEVFLNEWGAARFEQKASKSKGSDLGKQIEKKQQALAKMQADAGREDSQLLRSFAQSLQEGAGVVPPQELEQLLQGFVGSRFELAEKCFALAKQLEAKNEIRGQRIAMLQSELELLRARQVEGGEESQAAQEQGRLPELSQKLGAEARKLALGSGAVAYIGKSAKDNLLILRNAQARDMWIHLRDYPSAHAVIKRNKTYVLTDQDLRKVGAWLIKESLRNKAVIGDRYDVIFAECRYVKPIKGDKIGRVTYKNEKTIRLSYSSST